MKCFKVQLGISFSDAEPWICFCCVSLSSHSVSVLDNTEAAPFVLWMVPGAGNRDFLNWRHWRAAKPTLDTEFQMWHLTRPLLSLKVVSLECLLVPLSSCCVFLGKSWFASFDSYVISCSWHGCHGNYNLPLKNLTSDVKIYKDGKMKLHSRFCTYCGKLGLIWPAFLKLQNIYHLYTFPWGLAATTIVNIRITIP